MTDGRIASVWWKPHYLGFKQLNVPGVTLSRPEPSPIPADLPEYKEMMDEERRRCLPDT